MQPAATVNPPGWMMGGMQMSVNRTNQARDRRFGHFYVRLNDKRHNASSALCRSAAGVTLSAGFSVELLFAELLNVLDHLFRQV